MFWYFTIFAFIDNYSYCVWIKEYVLWGTPNRCSGALRICALGDIFLSLSLLIEKFQFLSKRHFGNPLGLSIYLDGMMDTRVSSCCEYRHRCGKMLGSRIAHFKLVKVEGGKPCYRCVHICICKSLCTWFIGILYIIVFI